MRSRLAEGGLPALSRQSQRRYLRLRNIEKSIRTNYRKLRYASQGMLDSHLSKIDGLLNSYLNLLRTQKSATRSWPCDDRA